MELALRIWISVRDTVNIRALPCIITWGIWMARNKIIFEDKWTEPDIVAAQCMGILQAFPQVNPKQNPRNIGDLVIDKSIPWAFFDGAAQGNPLICGGGGIIFRGDSNYYCSRTGLGMGSNNCAEFMALKLLMLLAIEMEIKLLNIMGDSMVIIKWANRQHECHIMRLRPIVVEIHHISTLFYHISFSHVYREHNGRAD